MKNSPLTPEGSDPYAARPKNFSKGEVTQPEFFRFQWDDQKMHFVPRPTTLGELLWEIKGLD